ncbi:uncharacterized protein Triagg1_1489 [Trichoderma aggressivum f. europaeum]|uniref:Uncharacterized protein n=1 Tax=Trichoderma aggressivum f. europaeum TaxID=173218 RepID=A0AAE1M6J0_9HYPO|nr:hypothetical protein Triagg1_1489 [Trichoderma aggressivum f. europaeum]
MADPPPEPTLLRPFGDDGKDDKNWFRVAFRFKRDEVLGWMKKVASKNNANCPPNDLRTDDHFKLLLEVYTELESLAATQGANYLVPKDECHIYRDKNPNFGPKKTQSKTVSPFVIKTWSHQYIGAPDPNVKDPPGPDAKVVTIGYWCIYDLIGLFLGLLGNAPLAADRNNFFLPLTAVYARWCTRLAGKLDNTESHQGETPGIGAPPAMFQCTWRERQDGKAKWFLLGASMAGGRFHKTPSEQDWKKTLQMQRFDMLVTHLKPPLVGRDDFGKTEPDVKSNGTGNRWGNCAETYPFVHCLAVGDESNETVQGLALSKKFVDQKTPVTDYSGYSDGKIWDSVVPPCANCAKLVELSNAPAAFFAKEYEKDKATAKTVPSGPPQEPEIQTEEVFVIRDVKELPVREMVEVASN